MSEICYDNSKYPIRSDFSEGHNRFWEKLAAPGSWLTGAERVAIAKEVRQAQHCNLCKQRKTALSANHVDGAHDTVSTLPDTIVEVVHRVITDNARLTKTWLDGLLQQGLTVEEYVEIIGTVVHSFLIDEFCRAAGEPLNELPQPIAGEPSRYRPENTVDDIAWVPMLPQVIESGPDTDLNGQFGANVIRSVSLVPENARTLIDLIGIHYIKNGEVQNLEVSTPGSSLSRLQVEILATRVSAFNECYY